MVVVLFYPVVGNLLLYSGALENIISRKPEKLKIQWQSAWTLIPGRVTVTDLNLDINTRNNRILIDVDQGVVELSLLSLLEKTVDIRSAIVDGADFSYRKHDRPAEQAKAQHTQSTTATDSIAEPAASPVDKKHGKKPWTIDLKNISGDNIRSAQFRQLNLVGNGRLHNLALRIVTKGGPLRIDDINVEMKALASPGLEFGDPNARYAQVEAQISLAENIPKQNKGRKLLEFLSGRVRVNGSSNSIEFLTALLGDKYQLTVSGGGELDMLAIVDSGELMDGSHVKFESNQFDTDFLSFHASGGGLIDASIVGSRQRPVQLKINVDDFRLNRHNVPNPYMEGADLNLELTAKRIFLHKDMEDGDLFVHFPDSNVRDLTDYNRFIPKHANVEILAGEGKLTGTLQIQRDIGHINMELTGSDVLMDVSGNRISSDLRFVTNLSDGVYGKKSYDLTGTYFRMEDTQLVTESDRTESGWWGEIRVSKGDVLLTEPVDINAEMKIKMRDTEPLITLLREEGKQKGLVDKILTIQDLEGTVGIQTTDKNVTLDPILINGNGLQVISRLDLIEKSMNGALYVKLRGIAVNFDIKDNKAKFRGFGGKDKVKKQVNLTSPHARG